MAKRRTGRRRTSRRKTGRRKQNRRRTAKGLKSWIRRNLLHQYTPDKSSRRRRYDMSPDSEMRAVDRELARLNDAKERRWLRERGVISY